MSTVPIQISPSILAADMGHLAEQAQLVQQAGADLLHVDVMDGRFVPNITVGLPVVRALARCCSLPLDVHLMIVEPERWVEQFAAAGAAIITVQTEATFHLYRTLQTIRAAGARPAVALNPATPLAAIEPVLDQVDMVLVMTVEPGFGGQDFLPGMLDKITRLAGWIRQRRLTVDIQVDGGINTAVAAQVVRAGANVLVAGTAIFGAPDSAAAVQALRNAAAGVDS